MNQRIQLLKLMEENKKLNGIIASLASNIGVNIPTSTGVSSNVNVTQNTISLGIGQTIVLDKFDDAVYKGAKYVILAKSTNFSQLLECLVVHHNHIPYFSVYGLTSNNDNQLFILDTAIEAVTTDIQLKATNNINQVLTLSLQKNYLV